MKKVISRLGICCWLAAPLADAATCQANLEESTPSNRFNATGTTVTDKETSLTWMRCAIGQSWTGSTCAGAATTMNWSEAVAMVEHFNQQGLAGQKDWRLPMMPELASIVERQCFNPRMNETVFPGAPSTVFWSIMEKMGTTRYAYTLDFGGGAAVATLKDFNGAVRLVRGGPWWTPPKMMSAK
ncbi:MAG: DUF1566 domain-containing protein [Pseudomonadota bacterium]